MSENNEKIPEAAAKKKSNKPNFFARVGGRIKKFFKDYSSEMKKIVWPTKSQVINNTIVVIVVSLIAAVVIFGLDTVFGFIVRLIYQNV